MLNLISFCCPLLLAATGALFSEYAGILALFLEGLISFSGFLTFTFTNLTENIVIGILLSALTTSAVTFLFAFIVEKTKSKAFIAALALNLLFSSIISLLSFVIFKTRGVLTSEKFFFPVQQVQVFAIIITVLLITAALCFLKFTQQGINFRITGEYPKVLQAKGINPELYRMLSWTITGFFAAIAGSILAMRISSFVPNLASSKGWMALAVVFLGRKKLWKMTIAVIIFCAADYLATNIQGYLSGIPTSVLLSFPYLIALGLIALQKD